MFPSLSRRDFLRNTATGAACLALPATVAATHKPEPFGAKQIIPGKPRERGLAYGKQFKDGIAQFLDKEIYGAFIGKPSPKDDMLRYASACGKVLKEVCPVVYEELGGAAEGSGFKFEELVLITLHEELYHRGVLPKVPHCTAVGVGPPDTAGEANAHRPDVGLDGDGRGHVIRGGVANRRRAERAGLRLPRHVGRGGAELRGPRPGVDKRRPRQQVARRPRRHPELCPHRPPALPGQPRSGGEGGRARPPRGVVHVRDGRQDRPPALDRGFAEEDSHRVREGPLVRVGFGTAR